MIPQASSGTSAPLEPLRSSRRDSRQRRLCQCSGSLEVATLKLRREARQKLEPLLVMNTLKKGKFSSGPLLMELLQLYKQP